MKRFTVVLLVIAVGMLAMPRAVRADAGPDGAAIFKAKCAMCHGADGKGQTPMGKSMHLKNLGSEEVQNMKNEDLNTLISEGKGKMPAFKSKLDQASIDAVIEFIRTLKK